jgi:hypothetical protein
MRQFDGQFDIGSTPLQAATRLVRAANHCDEALWADFNEVQMVARPGDAPELVAAGYKAEADAKFRAYLRSPERWRKELEARRQAGSIQEQTDAYLATRAAIDMDDLDEVITWLEELLAVTKGGIGNVDWHAVAKDLESHGYRENENADEAFDEHDRVNHGRYLIGQYLAFIKDGSNMNTLDNVFGRFAQEWRDLFAVTP